jgi:hypothetical protein
MHGCPQEPNLYCKLPLSMLSRTRTYREDKAARVEYRAFAWRISSQFLVSLAAFINDHG